MSSVFLAKVEMKEKEEKEKLKNSEVAGGNKESKRTVIWIHKDMSLINHKMLQGTNITLNYVWYYLQRGTTDDGEKGARKEPNKNGTGQASVNAGNVSGNPNGEEVGAGKREKRRSGNGGGGDGGGGPGPPSGPPTGSSGHHPSTNLTRKVLVLSQKGDWVACDATLRLLEKEAAEEGGNPKPLNGVADNVSCLSKDCRFIPDLIHIFNWKQVMRFFTTFFCRLQAIPH